MRRSNTPRILCFVLLALAMCGICSAHADDTVTPPSATDLAAITQRGQNLFDYDKAASDATDAVVPLKPDPESVGRYIARKTDTGWIVAFGRLSPARDAFQAAYVATRATGASVFTVQKYDPPKAETDFDLFAAVAIESALADFKPAHRSYNVAVLPADDNRLYVYLYPAQTLAQVWPVGADVRYTISSEGKTIIEKRRLHMSVFEDRPSSDSTVAIAHTAILADVPEDTDVFHVLSMKPSVSEYIGTKHFIYRLNPDGTITYMGLVDDQKNKQ